MWCTLGRLVKVGQQIVVKGLIEDWNLLYSDINFSDWARSQIFLLHLLNYNFVAHLSKHWCRLIEKSELTARVLTFEASLTGLVELQRSLTVPICYPLKQGEVVTAALLRF